MDDTLGLAIFAILAIGIFYLITRDSPVSRRPHKRGRLRRRLNSTPRLRANDEEKEKKNKEVTVTTRPHQIDFALFLMDPQGKRVRVHYRVIDAATKKYRELDLPLYEAIDEDETGWKENRVTTTGDLIVILYQTITTNVLEATVTSRERLSSVSGSRLANRRRDELPPIPFAVKKVHVTCYIPPGEDRYDIHSVEVFD